MDISFMEEQIIIHEEKALRGTLTKSQRYFNQICPGGEVKIMKYSVDYMKDYNIV